MVVSIGKTERKSKPAKGKVVTSLDRPLLNVNLFISTNLASGFLSFFPYRGFCTWSDQAESPAWDEIFSLPVVDTDTDLLVVVRNDDTLGKDEEMGRVV